MRKRNGHLMRLYGITPAEYDAMFEAQDGVCAICLKPETMSIAGVKRSLCVDHDHRTGQVRGLLCAQCNFAIGKLDDDPNVILAAAIYLTRAAQEAQLTA